MENVYGTVTVKADLQAFLSAAEDVETLTDHLKSIFEDIQKIAGNSKFYWNGDAANRHRDGFRKQQADMDQIIETLKKYPVDLRKISGNYDSTIHRNVETAQTLNTDFVML